MYLQLFVYYNGVNTRFHSSCSYNQILNLLKEFYIYQLKVIEVYHQIMFLEHWFLNIYQRFKEFQEYFQPKYLWLLFNLNCFSRMMNALLEKLERCL